MEVLSKHEKLRHNRILCRISFGSRLFVLQNTINLQLRSGQLGELMNSFLNGLIWHCCWFKVTEWIIQPALLTCTGLDGSGRNISNPHKYHFPREYTIDSMLVTSRQNLKGSQILKSPPPRNGNGLRWKNGFAEIHFVITDYDSDSMKEKYDGTSSELGRLTQKCYSFLFFITNGNITHSCHSNFRTCSPALN